jgi:hypothetical protein
LEIKLERAHDLSAVIHAERLGDGRVLITTVPLLYGTYTVTRGTGTFTLEPPLDLNLAAGWPLFKPEQLRAAEERFAELRQRDAGRIGAIPIPGVTPTETPSAAENQLVRVEQARPVEPPKVAAATPPPKLEKSKASAHNKGKAGKPSPTGSAVAAAKSKPSPAPSAPVQSFALQMPSPAPTNLAQPVAPDGTTLASTAGGGTWKTYPAGKMPLGRLISTTDLPEVADRGLAGERIYLRGQFLVNFSDTNKAVLRPRSRLPDSVTRLTGGNSTRIIVEYPAGYVPPAPGSTLTRDEARPLEITEVHKEEDGQLNVFAREIMQP